MLTVGSLFSGIGGFESGLERAGVKCVWQVEREPSCLKVLQKHWPDARRHTDVRLFTAATEPVRPDIICGGFPCQDLSVAGRRAGLAGERSGLFFEFMRIVEEFAPKWVLVENVPGLLSSNKGQDMGTVLWTLGELGYGWSYRVLDAQWFGVPQRRRRVFIVGCAGDTRRAAEVLFERESLPWDSPPRRQAGTRVAGTVTGGAHPGGFNGRDAETGNIAYGGNTNAIPLQEVNARQGVDQNCCGLGIGLDADVMYTLQAGHQHGVAFGGNNTSGPIEVATALNACSPASGRQDFESETFVREPNLAVRRLTPTECERLQGFPDGWTKYGADGKELSDSARYRMLGNAVAVPVAEWIGRRIVTVHGAGD